MYLIFHKHIFQILDYEDNYIIVSGFNRYKYRFPFDESMRFISAKNDNINLDLLKIIAIRSPFPTLSKLIVTNSFFFNALSKFFWTTYIHYHFPFLFSGYLSTILKKNMINYQLVKLIFLIPDFDIIDNINNLILRYNDDLEKLLLIDNFFSINWTSIDLKTRKISLIENTYIGFLPSLFRKKIDNKDKQTDIFNFYYDKNHDLNDDDLLYVVLLQDIDIINYIINKNEQFFNEKINLIQAIIYGRFQDPKDKITYLSMINSLYPNPGYRIHVRGGQDTKIIKWLKDNHYEIF